ncbi:MAG: hypothetical protein WBW78_11915, partial [Terrimicrobiaceae bacterium]
MHHLLSKVIIHVILSTKDRVTLGWMTTSGPECTPSGDPLAMSRAFSAGSEAVNTPGALPQAGNEVAPLALAEIHLRRTGTSHFSGFAIGRRQKQRQWRALI